jgi:hypothetical protein
MQGGQRNNLSGGKAARLRGRAVAHGPCVWYEQIKNGIKVRAWESGCGKPQSRLPQQDASLGWLIE